MAERAHAPVRVLIAGASIAGPALGYWLSRFGAEVTVVERAPVPRSGGQAVDARGVTREVIRRMGLDEQVRAACTQTAGAHTVDADGRILQTIRADDHGGDGYIAEIEILRGDLSELLREAAADRVAYRYGEHIVEVDQDADGVTVRFAGGGQSRYELVIGADGLHSALRGLVFGPREHYVRHLGHIAAFYRVPNEFGLDHWQVAYDEPGRHAGLRPLPREGNVAIAMFGFDAPDLRVDHSDVPAQKQLLRERMAGMGWLAPRMLAHLDTAKDFYLDQIAQVVMPSWSSRRVGLLGDAAFCPSPSSGQGTGVALVGAYVLAGELATAGWDPARGFAGYERLMRPFIEANQLVGRISSTGGSDPHTDDPAALERVGAAAINGITLPDYALTT